MQYSLKPLLKWPTILLVAGSRLFMKDYTYRASALAFVSLLSIVPVVSVIIYFFSFFPIFSTLIVNAQNYVYQNFVPASGEIIQKYLTHFTAQAGQLPLLSIIFFVITSAILFITIESTFHEIWPGKENKKRILILLFSAMILLSMPLFIGLSVLLSGFFLTLTWLSHYQILVLFVINLLVNTVAFGILYTLLLNSRIDITDGMIGGFVTAIIFEIVKKIFVIYIQYFTNYAVIYGAVAVIPIFLMWLYVSWLVILYSVLVIKVKNERVG